SEELSSPSSASAIARLQSTSTVRHKMVSATVLLLMASSLLLGSTSAEGAQFDYTLCKERLCLVNEDCIGAGSATNLVPYTNEKQCKILLAIWPYSIKKWRITIETRFDAPKGVSLRVLGHLNWNEKAKVVSCKKSLGSVIATTTISTYRTELIGGSHDKDHFNCEFFLHTTEDWMTKPIHRNDLMVVMYSTPTMMYGTATMLVDKLNYNVGRHSSCNPDRIIYDPPLAKPGQCLSPVISDRFELTCPQDYVLMYDDGIIAKSIKCVWQDNINWRRYNVKPWDIDGHVIEIPYGEDFKAYCTTPWPQYTWEKPHVCVQ
ncbi:hypothetical protein PENTCL1PPCAC_1519, partial [Pristionchus entomophagus]